MRKMKSLRNAVMLSMLTTSVVWGGTAFASATDLQEFDLDTMVVTASRVETAKVDTPANVSVVTAEKIENRHYQNVAEALKDVPGASVIDTGIGVEEKKVVLNGDERVLILVDGKRVSYDMGVASGRANYDMNQLPDVSIIDRIEVVKGHGGALYGSDAVGGAANSVAHSLAINLNGGTTEGTDKFTFDGSTVKNINITPASIGAATAGHTHKYAGSSTAGGAATSADKVNHTLTINMVGPGVGVKTNNGTVVANFGTKGTFDGSGDIILEINPGTVGAAAANHTHNYAGSSSAGGAATSANKVPVPVGTVMFSMSSTTTFFSNCFGGTWEVVGNLDATINGEGGTEITLYMFKKIKD